MTGGYYRYFGLSLHSDRPLPRLDPLSARAADVSIAVTERPSGDHRRLPWARPDPTRSVWRAATDGGSWLRLRYAEGDDWAEFIVDPRGQSISVTYSEEVVWDELCALLLGPVFSCVLAQRGVTCLHAGVVKVDDQVVGFVGATGAGKSTTNLAFVQHGATLVSDDVAALCQMDGRPAVTVGAPRLRVKKDAAEVLRGSFDGLEPMWAETSPRPVKRYLGVRTPPSDAAVPLDALYFLAPRRLIDQEPMIRPMSAVEAVPRLMANRHMVELLERGAHQRDFAVLARVAASVRTCELVRPDGLHAMDRTVQAVLADLVAVA